MDRLRQTAHAAAAALPGSFENQLTILRRVADGSDPDFVAIWFSEFVSLYGLEKTELSLSALRRFTSLGSAEFAIRPFIQRAPSETLAVMQEWTRDSSEHVGRLASEGSRPRLPWGTRLGFLGEDPAPTRLIIEALKTDPSLYVRKSVANHFNDIAKDHPDYVVSWVTTWDRANPDTAWIVRHGLRTLIKKGHRGVVNLIGAGAEPKLERVPFTLILEGGQESRFFERLSCPPSKIRVNGTRSKLSAAP
ncbi:MAG: hypothetical protein J6386_09800 [Candidatus Synoicihabitans palmerolidicus]|nr:hypothetical protein [Candidatus Synoicihabitans palmerolidicus]